jgi:glutathione reductase (NADPH)
LTRLIPSACRCSAYPRLDSSRKYSVHFSLTDLRSASGVETHVVLRKNKILTSFDQIIQDTLKEQMTKTGIHFHTESRITKVTTSSKSVDLTKSFPKTVETDRGEVINDVGVLLWAIGRSPETEDLGVGKVNLKLDKTGYIVVDEYQNTNVPSITAIGDVQGQALLTPVAIAAGRRLANRLFGGMPDDKLSYENIPSVVFS